MYKRKENFYLLFECLKLFIDSNCLSKCNSAKCLTLKNNIDNLSYFEIVVTLLKYSSRYNDLPAGYVIIYLWMENNQLIKQYLNLKTYFGCNQKKGGGRATPTIITTTTTTTEGGELILSQRGGGMIFNHFEH